MDYQANHASAELQDTSSKPKERISAAALGAWMKRQRELRGLTQEQVAERSGKRQSQIAKLESGTRLTIPAADVASYAHGVMATESAALRAINHFSVSYLLQDTETDEEALAIAEAYIGYKSLEAKEIIRQALRYADSVELGIAMAKQA